MYDFNIATANVSGNSDEKFATTRVKSGWCRAFTATINNNTNNVTGTVKVYDVDGNVIYTKSGLAEAATTLVNDCFIPMKGDVKVGVQPSGDPGASGFTCAVRFYLVED